MENRTHAIIAVSFLLVFSLGAIFIYYWLADRKPEPLVYEVVTSQSIGGLAQQSGVVFKGLPVGHVTHVGFDPADRSRVVLRMHLKAHTYVTQATYAVVTKQGLTGGSVLELKLGKGSRAPLPTSAEHPAHIPLHLGLLASLERSARKDMHDIQDVLASARKLLGPDNRKHITASLAQIDTVTRRLAAIEKQMPALVKGVQQSVEQSHALLKHANHLVQEAQKPVRKASDLETSIQNLARSSHRLSQRLNHQSAPDFHALSQSLEHTSTQLDQLLRELKAKPQSLIFGPPQHPPGPGEPGFPHGTNEDQGHD